MKSKTKTQSKQSSTTNPIIPGFVSNAVQSQQDRINNLGAGGADQYVAPTSPLQDAAFKGGAALASRMGISPGMSSTPGMQSGPIVGMGGGGMSSSPGMQSGPIEGMGGPELSNAPGTFSGAGEKYQTGAPSQGGLLGGGLASPDPNTMFTGAGLLAADAGTAGANTADRNVLGNAAGYDPAMIGELNPMQAAQISADDISRLMNPYVDQVSNAALSQYDNSAAEREAQMQAAAAGNNAFGGSRYGVAQGQFAADTVRDRASLDAGLRSDAFNTAIGYADNDVNRRQNANSTNYQGDLTRRLANQSAANQGGQFNASNANQFALNQFGADNSLNAFNAGQEDSALMRQLSAAGLLGDLGRTVGSEDRANLGLLSGLGEQQRGVDQDVRNAEPLLAQLIASLNAQQGYGNFIGQTSQGESSGTTTESGPAQWLDTMKAVGQGAQAGKILFSDERLKDDIETVGFDAEGRRWVDFSYKWGGPRMRGVIAQEVARTDPGAVITDASGFLKVDYSKLGGAHV